MTAHRQIHHLLILPLHQMHNNSRFYLSREDSHFCKDATEKVLILRKTVQDKVYLYVFHYYILYVKTVFQWRPASGE